MPKTKVTFFLDPTQIDALKLLSAKTRIAQAVLLREGVDLLLAKYKKLLKK